MYCTHGIMVSYWSIYAPSKEMHYKLFTHLLTYLLIYSFTCLLCSLALIWGCNTTESKCMYLFFLFSLFVIVIVNFLISRAPTKAKSQEPVYSQALNQNKIDRQQSRSRECCCCVYRMICTVEQHSSVNCTLL